jgi:sulfide:quinone oxidoreductase
MRVVVLGAGFGGLEVATLLSEEFGDEHEVVVVDRSEHFVFGFSKLDVMFGRTTAAHVVHRYADFAKPGVRFLRSTVRAIDPTSRRVTVDDGVIEADVLVVALGADLDPAAIPGLSAHGHEFYTVGGGFALRETLARFAGGRVVVGVTSTPFKCPPAPSETALLMHELLHDRGLLDTSHVALVMPLGAPIPPSPEASAALVEEFARRCIAWHPNRLVRRVHSDRVSLADGDDLPCDLFLAVPPHRAPDVVVEAGLTVDGWIPVDPQTMQTSFPGIFAVGDVTSVGTPKAGVFAEGQAVVAAARISAVLRGEAPDATYDGRGICYLEFGGSSVAKVDVTFQTGERPFGTMEGPSPALVQDKQLFGSSRIRRWFGTEWTTS